jgi:hemerythrin
LLALLKFYILQLNVREEDYLDRISYKEFLKHKNEHKKFINEFSNVDLSSADSNQDKYLQHVIEFVFKWIDHHILMEDLKYLQ